MFQSTIDFLMILDINKTLKMHNLNYEVHSFSGCASCGLQLIKHQDQDEKEKVLQIINEYLKAKWLKATYSNDGMIYINSKFE